MASSIDLSELYQVGTSEKVREAETELAHELAELRTELEEVDIPPKMTSSVPIPESKEHFKEERKFVIKRALEVSEAQQLRIQAEEMKIEMSSAEELEYTTKSLPLLLHQHFTERIQQLVLLKHMHMLRWKRFCEHTSTIESLYPVYTQRLTHLLNEYKDCVQRAQRLSAAREALMLHKPDAAVSAINTEDLLIYLRWLVCHFHSVKRFNQFLKVLQWLPVSHKTSIAPSDPNAAEKEEPTHASKMASRYQDDPVFSPGTLPGNSRPPSARSNHSVVSPVPSPPPINIALLNTSPLPTSAMLYAAAASGGGLASDESSCGLPLHTMDLDSFKPQLAFLINAYGISFDLNRELSSADEMEMFGAVNRRFKHIFLKQEHLNSFRTYDFTEGPQDSALPEGCNYAYQKQSNWLPYISVWPSREPSQEKVKATLRQAKRVDELLRVQSHFLSVSSAEKVQETLKEHASQVRYPRQVQVASVTSHRTQNNTSATWKKIYSNPDLYTQSEKDDIVSIPDIDERDVENVTFGGNSSRGNSARKRKDSYDYLSTVQMLGLDEGEQDEADPVTVQGAYLSYLHLRHLRMRDLQRTCLSVLNYFRSLERTLTINDMGLATDNDSQRRARLSESEFIQFSEVENHDDFYTVEEGRVHVLDQRGLYIVYDKAREDLRELESDLLLICSHYIEKDRDHRVGGRRTGSNRGHTVCIGFVLALVEQQREFIQRVTREGDMEIGLPHRIVPKQLIAVNLSRPALKNVYMLEFHPTLAIASRIPAALQLAYWLRTSQMSEENKFKKTSAD
ncbi:coiled-coil domain-containing protein 162-like [Elysia marginata]|uniref:Coiled-coil domain-containing protein 162-like n=1 Tax=Elysia marginata TaxID=1093978 RepID=A0AAV4FL74_9GAST|nr:coiled-coil domain-containing protein 162-like [Elysia marginata]